MKGFQHFLLFILVFGSIDNTYSFGVVIDNENYNTLYLQSSDYDAEVYNQILSSNVTSTYVNNYQDSLFVKYIFPLEEFGTITSLNYNYKGVIYEANLVAGEQDSLIPTNGITLPQQLRDYHGIYPLLFDCPIKIGAGDTISFTISYVDLLSYQANITSLQLPFTTIENEPIENVSVNINLTSERELVDIQSVSSHNSNINFSTFTATVDFSADNFIANNNFLIEYQLLSEDLGIQLISTYLEEDSTALCDSMGGGYAAFIVEPNPPTSEVIEKDFVLIIDVSGSMNGQKIQQAKDAANFIIDNLNPEDRFNIVAFSSEAQSYDTGMNENNFINRNDAHNFINGLSASGGTNITASFQKAIPLFQNSANERAKMILFFTDGQQSGEEVILSEIYNLRVNFNPDISIFSFGIGQGANQSLLSQIASQNNGLAEFVGNEELFSTLSNFYTLIQNPVLLDLVIEFSPGIVFELYPAILPNLYKGQQLLLAGRYNIADSSTMSLSGTAFSENQLFQYGITLADTSITSYSFLPKLWSNLKIKSLMYDYYASQNQVSKDSIENKVTYLSICYGVLSPFTSFQVTDPWQTYDYVSIFEEETNDELVFISPNPVQSNFKIINIKNATYITIFDINGQIVYETLVNENMNVKCDFLSEGNYIVEIKTNDKIYLNKFIKI